MGKFEISRLPQLSLFRHIPFLPPEMQAVLQIRICRYIQYTYIFRTQNRISDMSWTRIRHQKLFQEWYYIFLKYSKTNLHFFYSCLNFHRKHFKSKFPDLFHMIRLGSVQFVCIRICIICLDPDHPDPFQMPGLGSVQFVWIQVCIICLDTNLWHR